MPNNRLVLFLALIIIQITQCKGDDNMQIQIDFTAPMFSRLNENGRAVMKKYAEHYVKIKSCYRNIRMDATKQIFDYHDAIKSRANTSVHAQPELVRKETITIRYNTPLLSADYARIDSQIQFIKGYDANSRYAKQIDLFTPDRFYGLEKHNPQNDYYALAAKRDRKQYESTVGRSNLEFDSAAFIIGPMLVEYFLFTPPYFAKDAPFLIASAKEAQGPDGFTEIAAFVDDTSSSTMWIIRLLPHSWVIKDVLYKGATMGGEKFWKRYSCSYSDEFNGIPLLSMYVIDTGNFNNDVNQTENIESHTLYEITNLVPGPPDLSEFDVAQFLPPNTKIGEITYTPFSIYRIAAIAFGIVLVIIGIAMKIRFIIIETRKQQQKK